MKFVILFVLFSLFTLPLSLAANVTTEGEAAQEEAEQPITVCSMLTGFEEAVRNCIEVPPRGEYCGLGLFETDTIPEDVKDTIKAFLTNVLSSCDEDLQCILTETVAAKTEHQCAASE